MGSIFPRPPARFPAAPAEGRTRSAPQTKGPRTPGAIPGMPCPRESLGVSPLEEDSRPRADSIRKPTEWLRGRLFGAALANGWEWTPHSEKIPEEDTVHTVRDKPG
jgi:hypothetical protein